MQSPLEYSIVVLKRNGKGILYCTVLYCTVLYLLYCSLLQLQCSEWFWVILERPPINGGDATLLTSLVVQYSPFYAVEVRISPSTLFAQKKLTVIVNQQVVTFYMPTANQTLTTMTVQSSLQIIVKNADQSRVQLKYLQSQLFVECQYISIITSTVGEMSCRLQIPLAYQNQTTGLIGNWQSNATQDLRPPSYPSSSYFDPTNASIIFPILTSAYKLTNASYSLFTYASGENFNTFFSQTVSPDYNQIPAQSPQLTDNSTVAGMCGSSPQCVYDAYYTGSLTAAASTRYLITRVTSDQLLINTSFANLYCPYPDVPYAVMSYSSLANGASLTITGCQSGFSDNLGGTTSCTCNAPSWSCDLASQRCRCIGTPDVSLNRSWKHLTATHACPPVQLARVVCAQAAARRWPRRASPGGSWPRPSAACSSSCSSSPSSWPSCSSSAASASRRLHKWACSTVLIRLQLAQVSSASQRWHYAQYGTVHYSTSRVCTVQYLQYVRQCNGRETISKYCTINDHTVQVRVLHS